MKSLPESEPTKVPATSTHVSVRSRPRRSRPWFVPSHSTFPVDSFLPGRLLFGFGPALLVVAAVALLGVVAPPPALAQGNAQAQFSSGPRVFLDCQGRIPCDRTHFRTEIQFVNWAQDREDSDVHVIVTSESVGGGGQRYTFDFIGRDGMEGVTDRFTHTSSGADVMTETRDALTQVLRIGLLRYAAQMGMADAFQIAFTGQLALPAGGGDLEAGGDAVESAIYDPWNQWTFRVGLSGDLDLREARTNTRFNPTLSADRVTEEWKLNLSSRVDFRRDRRELSDGREIRDDRDDWRLNALIVRSISSHISVGVDTEARNSVGFNQHARIRFAPAVEYNYYPYAEANRRQLITHYSIGVEHSNYIEETMFGFEEQTTPLHRMAVQYNAREEWGNAGVGAEVSQYLHDSGLYSFGISGNVNFRIVRGLDLNVSGSASRVNDNIHTPASAISDEDILLGRQSLPSSYRYQGGVGLSYRWGSSFTNVVNTRFPGSVR